MLCIPTQPHPAWLHERPLRCCCLQQPASAIVNAQITVAKGATSNSQLASVPTMKPDICAAQLAPGVRRESRITRPPRRPKDGWTLVVQPLSRRRNKVGGLCATLLFAVS